MSTEISNVPPTVPPTVVRRGRGNFTSTLKSDEDPKPQPSSVGSKSVVPVPDGGFATRVLTESQQENAPRNTAANEGDVIPTVAYEVYSAHPHPNPNKNKMGRPSANFKNDENARPGTAASDTVREQLFRKERRRRSIVIVGNTYALNKFSAVRLSNYSEKKPARLENQFLKGVHVSVPLRRLRIKAKETKDDNNGVAEEEEDPHQEAGEDNEDIDDRDAQQRIWECQEEEDLKKARRQANEELLRMAEAFDDGKLHPLTVDRNEGGSGVIDHYSSRNNDTNPLLVSPVLTCSRFSSLANFFVETFHDLWSLEDTKSQKVSIKLEFGKAFYTRSSRASSFSADSDFQRQRKVPFTNFIEGLNKETSQLYFINDAPLTVARGLDAVVDTRNKATYTLVKIFFFSKERQSHIVVRAIWDQQFDCFELTDIEHIGITFSWLILNLEDLPLEDQQRDKGAATKAPDDEVFLRHALPVEVQFRAFQRKKTLVGHPLEKKAKFILRKLTAAEHDRLHHGHGSYDSVDFHAIARGKDGKNEGESGENSGVQSPTSSSSPTSTGSPLNPLTAPPRSGDVPRLARKNTSSEKNNSKSHDKKPLQTDVVAINDDEYEVASINIEHIETRKTKSGIMLDSASGLLIEHFEDHLMFGINKSHTSSSPSGGGESGESNEKRLNAGLTFLQYRSCNIHWKMDPAKSALENLNPSLADALEVCEKVLNRANTFEHEEFVSSRKPMSGDVDDLDGARYKNEFGKNASQDEHQEIKSLKAAGTRGRGRGGPVGAIGEDCEVGEGRGGGYRNNNNRVPHNHEGGHQRSKRGGGVSAIDAFEHRHQPTNRGRGGARSMARGMERGRGRSSLQQRGNDYPRAQQDEDLWDMPASNYRPGVVPPSLPAYLN